MNVSRLPVVSFLVAEFLALLGNSAFLVVLPWLVLSYAGNASVSSAITALVTVPTAVATLAAGRMITRVGRKPASVVAGTGCALVAGLLALADGSGHLSLPVLVALGMGAQLFVSPSTTARDALMSDVAGAGAMAVERLAGMRQATFSVAYAVGPALAGLLLGVCRSSCVLGAVTAAWALAALLTAVLPAGDRHLVFARDSRPRQSSLRGVLRSRHCVRSALVIGCGTAVISAPMTSVLLPAHFRALGQPQLYGAVVSGFAVGALVGSLAYAALAKRARGSSYIAAVIATSLGIAGFALLPTFWLLMLALFVGGVGSGLLAPMLLVAVTNGTTVDERGQALGVYNAVSLGAGPLGLGLLSLLLHASPNLHVGTCAVLLVWVAVAIYALVCARAITTPEVPSPATEYSRG